MLVGCSGGPDSVVLADVLLALAPELQLDITVASVDHGLRPEAAREVEHVRGLAEHWQVPFRSLRLGLATGPGAPARARAARYEALDELRRDLGADVLAVGHTRDDQAETVLSRLLRGSGVRGLRGIRRLRFRRPVLPGQELRVRLIGDSAAENVAAVAAVLEALGFVAHHAFQALAAVEPEPGRLVPRPLKGERLLLDDTYNANPASTAMAIKTASRIATEAGRPFVAVLGDMRELGRNSVAEHRAVGGLLASLKARLLITAGPEMRAAARAARERGVLVYETGSSEAAALAALALVHDRDVVLVKGSRSLRMERVVDTLSGQRATDEARG